MARLIEAISSLTNAAKEITFIQSLLAGHTFCEACEASANIVGNDNAGQTSATQLTRTT